MRFFERGFDWRGLAGWALALAIVLGMAIPGALAQSEPPGTYTPSADAARLSGTIVADGSSTVGPVSEAAAEDFAAIAPDVQVEVSISGTGGGFERFCKGETDIQNASRAMKDSEREKCAEAGVEFYVFEVAYDGLAIVVNPSNEAVNCLTVEQLAMMWRPDDPVKNWSQIDPSFPDERIRLYGPGPSSGTFDYFTSAIVGESGSSTVDYLPSEDDNQLVEGVAGDKYSLAYFGLAYYELNQDRLNVVAVDDGHGCVIPTTETVRNLTYSPLSRPLYLYVNAASIERPEMQEFMRFYLSAAPELAVDVGYVASPTDVYERDRARLEAAIAGTGTPDSVIPSDATPSP